MGENHVVVARGLEADDAVLLVPPTDGGTLDLDRLEDAPEEPAVTGGAEGGAKGDAKGSGPPKPDSASSAGR
jgi:hypothetical protein